MYCDVGQWRHIRSRILEKGTPKKQVARETGVSRRTINKMLTHEHGYGFVDRQHAEFHDARPTCPSSLHRVSTVPELSRYFRDGADSDSVNLGSNPGSSARELGSIPDT